MAGCGLGDRRLERGPVGFGHHRQDRAAARQQAFERRGEARIAAGNAAGLVDGGNGHRRVLEKAHEAHFRRALRIGAVVARAVEHQGARHAGFAVGAERDFMKQPHRHRLARARAQIEIEHLGLDVAGRGIERRQQRRAFAGDDIGQPQRTGADLRQIVIEPGRQGRVQIDNVAGGIDREETGRRVVEIIDGVLQLLEHILLTLAFARHVGDRPDRHLGIVLAGPERPHPQAQPARRLAARARDAHFFHQPALLARRLEQAIDRFRNVGVADEHPLDRPDILAVGGADQVEIGGVGVEHAARLVGDQDPVERIVDHRLQQRIAMILRGQAHDARCRRKQREDADRAQHRQQRHDVGFGVIRPDINEAGGGGDQQQRNQQHHADRARARRALTLVERPPPGRERRSVAAF